MSPLWGKGLLPAYLCGRVQEDDHVIVVQGLHSPREKEYEIGLAFSQYGEIEQMSIETACGSTGPEYALIWFEKCADMEKAIAAMNGSVFDGQVIKVEQAKYPFDGPAGSYEGEIRPSDAPGCVFPEHHTILVEGFPRYNDPTLEESKLREAFGKFGNIDQISNFDDSKLIWFSTERSMEQAIEEMNGVTFGEQTIFVREAKYPFNFRFPSNYNVGGSSGSI